MDRLIREANPPTGQLASPKPQYKKPGVDEYEPVEGQHGAPFAILKDASGNVVSPATDAKLEQVKSELELVKSELEAIKANQLSGDQKVQLSGTIVRQAFSYIFGPNCVVAVGDEVKSTATANEIIPLDISSCNHIQVYFKNSNDVNLVNLKLHFTHDLQPRPLTYEGGVEGAWFTESIAGVALPNTEYWVYVDTTNPDKTDFLHRKAIGLILEWKNVTPSGRACDYSIIGGV